MSKFFLFLRKIIKTILWIILIALIIAIGISFINPNAFRENHGKNLANHYEKYENEILELIDFVAKHNTKNIKFQIEFEENYSKFWFRIERKKDEPYPYTQNYDANEFLQILGWNNDTLNLLKNKLKVANCVSFENHFYSENSVIIGVYRTFLDMYFFKIYDNNVSKNEILKQTDNCLLKYYKDNIVFKFGQSAITSGCGFW